MIHKLAPVRLLLVVLAVAGLAVDAYVHFDVAHNYDLNATSTMSQGDLFRIEAVGAIVVGVLLLALPRWYIAALASLVALVAAAAVLYTAYHDLPKLGPAPKIYQEDWYTEKVVSFIGELVAFFAAGALALLLRPASVSSRPKPGATANA